MTPAAPRAGEGRSKAEPEPVHSDAGFPSSDPSRRTQPGRSVSTGAVLAADQPAAGRVEAAPVPVLAADIATGEPTETVSRAFPPRPPETIVAMEGSVARSPRITRSEQREPAPLRPMPGADDPGNPRNAPPSTGTIHVRQPADRIAEAATTRQSQAHQSRPGHPGPASAVPDDSRGQLHIGMIEVTVVSPTPPAPPAPRSRPARGRTPLPSHRPDPGRWFGVAQR